MEELENEYEKEMDAQIEKICKFCIRRTDSLKCYTPFTMEELYRQFTPFTEELDGKTVECNSFSVQSVIRELEKRGYKSYANIGQSANGELYFNLVVIPRNIAV